MEDFENSYERKQKHSNGLSFMQDLYQMKQMALQQKDQNLSYLINQCFQIEIIEKGFSEDILQKTYQEGGVDNQINNMILTNMDRSNMTYGSDTWQFTIIKIKENLGISEWIVQNMDLLRNSIQRIYSCQILINVSRHGQYILIDQQEEAQVLHIQDIDGMNRLNECDIAFIFQRSDFNINIHEIMTYVKLQRILKSNYFLSLKYFPLSFSDDLIQQGVYNITYFYDLKTDFEQEESQQLYQTLQQIAFDFDQHTYIQEQNFISSQLSLQEISQNMQTTFDIDSQIIHSQFMTNQGVQLSLLSGCFQSTREQNIIFYFFENGQLMLKEDRLDIQKELLCMICAELENYNVQFNQKACSNQFNDQRELKKRRTNKSYLSYVIIIHAEQLQEQHQQNQNIWQSIANEFVYFLHTTDFFQKFIHTFDLTNQENSINAIIQSQIPSVVEIMQDISHIFQEPFQPEESQLIKSCLSKLFIINLI